VPLDFSDFRAKIFVLDIIGSVCNKRYLYADIKFCSICLLVFDSDEAMFCMFSVF